jgi:hypothetical protein
MMALRLFGWGAFLLSFRSVLHSWKGEALGRFSANTKLVSIVLMLRNAL